MKLHLVLLFCFTSLVICAQNNLSALIPYPNTISIQKGEFSFSKNEKISIKTPDLQFVAKELQQILENHLGEKIEISSTGRIKLEINSKINNSEGYLININNKEILIQGKSFAGILYGVMTLDQVLIGDVTNTKIGKIQAARIEDSPSFPFRALMIDPARHFLPIEDVKFYIDQMVKYKYNTLQIHLADDQGWRIEIKSHPKLTEIGAFRNPKGGSKGPDNGFYTQEELKDLVQYASKRNIQIIPEIDIPGHTAALLAAYPDLRCDFLIDSTFVLGTTDNVMLSASNPDVYKVLDDILREVSDIFPSKTIHLGGDESAIDRNWAKSSEHLELMKKNGYTEPRQLMNIFFGNVLASVKKYGMKAILWCELDNVYMPANEYLFDYPNDVILVTWRMGLTPKCIELTAKSKNTLILAPGEYCYFDYPQYKNDFPEFLNWGMPITSLEKTYQFNPTYNLPIDQRNHIAGVMGTLWGEAIKDINRVNYMTWPRGLALAEAGWTNQENRDWESFKSRMYPNLLELMKWGVSLRVPFEIGLNKH